MRKTLKLVAIVGLALLVATPAMALDFKFGAEYRVRFYSGLGVGFDKEVGSSAPRGVQIRVRPRFDVTDDNGNVGATLRLEIGDIEFGNGGGAHGVTNSGGVSVTPGSARVGNGSGGSLGVDGVNVETKWAYMDFAAPWGVPLRIRAGLQPWFLSKGLIMDDDVAGVRAYGKWSMLSYDLGWYRVSGGPATSTANTVTQCNLGGAILIVGNAASCTALGGVSAGSVSAVSALNASTSNTQDNNYDFWQAKFDLAIASGFNPGIYYLYGRNAASSAFNAEPGSTHFVGATVAGKFPILSYDLDFIWGQMDGGPSGAFGQAGTNNREKTSGFVVDGGVHVPIGPVVAHVVGSYATGDKRNGGRGEMMPWISPSWNGAGGLYELIGSGGVFDAVEYTQDYPGNLWMMGLVLEYRPVKAIWTKLAYGFAGFTQKRGNCAYTAGITGTLPSCFGPSYTGKGFSSATGEGGLAGKSTLGHELSLRADWDLWTNFKVQGEVGWLFPSKGSTAHEYVLQLFYSF